MFAMKWILAILLGFAFASSPLVVTLPAALPQKTASPVRRAVIDINRASADDFTRLPGIGPKLAQQIVAYRTKQGPFHRVEDLMIIKGIGSKKWNALRPYVCVGCTAMRK
jgi:competence protein ComEA